MSELINALLDLLSAVQSMIPSTISPLELIWTIPMLSGMQRFARRWIVSDHSRDRLRNAKVCVPGDSIDIVSTKRWLMNGFLTVAFEFFAAVGIINMLIPAGPAQDFDSEYATLGLINSIFMISAGLTLVLMGEIMDSQIRSLYRWYARPQKPKRKSAQLTEERAPNVQEETEGIGGQAPRIDNG